MPRIKDNVVVITGATSGIGEAGLSMRNAECGECGVRNAMAGLVKLARERYGQLDVLVAEFTDCPICLPVVNAPL
jgi:hypothetical protein